MQLVINNQAFKALDDNQLLEISGGNCTWETIKEHPFKTFFFGAIYVAGVYYGCNY